MSESTPVFVPIYALDEVLAERDRARDPATPDRVAQLEAAIVRTTPTSPRPTLAQLEDARRTR